MSHYMSEAKSQHLTYKNWLLTDPTNHSCNNTLRTSHLRVRLRDTWGSVLIQSQCNIEHLHDETEHDKSTLENVWIKQV